MGKHDRIRCVNRIGQTKYIARYLTERADYMKAKGLAVQSEDGLEQLENQIKENLTKTHKVVIENDVATVQPISQESSSFPTPETPEESAEHHSHETHGHDGQPLTPEPPELSAEDRQDSKKSERDISKKELIEYLELKQIETEGMKKPELYQLYRAN